MECAADLVRGLLAAPTSGTSCEKLRMLARTAAGASAAIAAGALAPLIALVGGGSDRSVRTAACLALANLVGRTSVADDEFVHAGGISVALSALVRSPVDEELAIAACGVLQNISARWPSAQAAVGNAGGVAALLNSLDGATTPFLAEAACKALAHACQLPENQSALAAAGGLGRLLEALGRHRTARAALAACGALQNATTGRPDLQAALGRAGGATSLVGVLSRHGAADAQVAAAVCSALSTIVLQPSTHAAVAYAGGVAPLLATLAAHPRDAEVGLYGCRVALALLAGSADCAAALLRDGACEAAAWSILVEALGSGNVVAAQEVNQPEAVAEAACTLIAAIAAVAAAPQRQRPTSSAASASAAGFSPVTENASRDKKRVRALATVLRGAQNPRIACAACTVASLPSSGVLAICDGDGASDMFEGLVASLQKFIADSGVVRPACIALAELVAFAPRELLLIMPSALAPLASAIELHLADRDSALAAIRALAALAASIDPRLLADAGIIAPIVLAMMKHADSRPIAAATTETLVAVASSGAPGAVAVARAGGVPQVVALLVRHAGHASVAVPASRCLLALLGASSMEKGTGAKDVATTAAEYVPAGGFYALIEHAGGFDALAVAVREHEAAFGPSLVAEVRDLRKGVRTVLLE